MYLFWAEVMKMGKEAYTGVLLTVAIGIIDAYVHGVDTLLGFGVAILYNIIGTFLGIFPGVGQAVYYFVMKPLMVDAIGVWLPYVFWYNFGVSIIVSFVVISIIILIKNGYDVNISFFK